MSIRVEIEDWLDGDLKKATTDEERLNIEKRQALRNQIADLAEQDDQLENEYNALSVTKARRQREWDEMPEEQKRVYGFFSRKMLKHAVSEINLASNLGTNTAKPHKTIRFFS